MSQHLVCRNPGERGSLEHTDDQICSFWSNFVHHFVNFWLFFRIKFNPKLTHFDDSLRPGGWISTNIENPVQLVNIGGTAKDFFALVEFQDKCAQSKDIRLSIVRES